METRVHVEATQLVWAGLGALLSAQAAQTSPELQSRGCTPLAVKAMHPTGRPREGVGDRHASGLHCGFWEMASYN